MHHTHDDVGWLKTKEQYYSGSDPNMRSNASVETILDSVVGALLANEERRFSYVEVSFFEHWWKSQVESIKTQVRELVNSGRLELVNGG